MTRRYDVDWLRVFAIFLLLIYHIAIMFQPWGKQIAFIQSEESSSAIWIPMALINVWRIPLLFFVSGMGVCFALRKRNWKELLIDRAKRILLPLIFGSFFIVPLHIFIFQKYYNLDLIYSPSVGHLWFLLNICIYITQVIGFAFLDQKYDYKIFKSIRNMLKRPYFIYLFYIPFILEAVVINPDYFSMFVGNGHGFILGMFAFFFGFLFVAIGDSFWNAASKMRFVSLSIAIGLYLVRFLVLELNGINLLTSIESMSWIYSAFGFAYVHLNKPSKLLTYLSQSVYPVYIIHMIFFFAGAYFILPLNLSIELSLISIILFTIVGCYLTYELIIKRINLIKPLFGLKRK